MADRALPEVDSDAKGSPTPLPSDARVVRRLEGFAETCALLGIAFGGWVLAAWWFGFRGWTTFPGQAVVKANTGLCFLLVGLSLYLLRKWDARPGWVRLSIALACAMAASAIGLLSFVEVCSGRDFGIDQLLFRAGAEGALASVRPGLMSPVSGLAFFLLGAALALIASQKKWVRRLQQGLGVASPRKR